MADSRIGAGNIQNESVASYSARKWGSAQTTHTSARTQRYTEAHKHTHRETLMLMLIN